MRRGCDTVANTATTAVGTAVNSKCRSDFELKTEMKMDTA